MDCFSVADRGQLHKFGAERVNGEENYGLVMAIRYF